MFQSANLEEQILVSPLVSDLRDLEFTMLGFSFTLVQYFLPIPPIPPFSKGNVYSLTLYVSSM